MFWKCSFQRVYRPVSGSADSKGASEQRHVTSGFAEQSVAAPSLCIVSRNFRIANHPEVGQKVKTSAFLGTYLVSVNRSSTLTQEHRLIVAPRIN